MRGAPPRRTRANAPLTRSVSHRRGRHRRAKHTPPCRRQARGHANTLTLGAGAPRTTVAHGAGAGCTHLQHLGSQVDGRHTAVTRRLQRWFAHAHLQQLGSQVDDRHTAVTRRLQRWFAHAHLQQLGSQVDGRCIQTYIHSTRARSARARRAPLAPPQRTIASHE